MATVRASFETRTVPPPRIRELRFPSRPGYLMSGAPARARYVVWSFLIVPFRQSRSSALFTQRVSELPFCSTIPKCSFVPRVGSLPTMTPSETWTAVT